MKRPALVLLAAFAFCLMAAPAPAAPAQQSFGVGGDRSANMRASGVGSPDSIGVIVQFKQPATAPLGAQLLAAINGSSAAPVSRGHGLYSLGVSPTLTDEQYALSVSLSASGLEYAVPNYVRHVAAYAAPTDPDFTNSDTWSDGTDYYFGAKHWWLDAMKMPTGWAIGQGSTYPVRAGAADVKIAVLDVGFFLNHPDFSGGTLTAGKDEFASYDPNTDQFTNDLNVTPDSQPLDRITESHGTATAAAVGAEINGTGMVGSGWNPQIVGYKIAGPITSGWYHDPAGTVLILDSAAAAGIYDAVDAGCKVINMSFGGPSYSRAYEAAVTYAHDHGVVVCASVGNDGDGTTVNYPAACKYVTGVGAVAHSGGSVTQDGTVVRSDLSDFAPGVVDLVAPGEMFWSATRPDWNSGEPGAMQGYRFWNGTSFSSPAVAGAIAYLWRAMPGLSNDEIVGYVENSAVDLGTPGRDDYFGCGLVDMHATYVRLISDYPMLAKPAITSAQYVRAGQSLSWTASAGYNVTYEVTVDGTVRSSQTSTAYALPALAEGRHSFSVLPTSSRNWDTSSLAAATLTLDSVSPSVSGFSSVGGILSWTVAETNPYTVRAYVDTATPVVTIGNSLSVSALPAGTHVIHVNATDAAGNSSGWVTWDFPPPTPPVVPSITATDALTATVSWPEVSGAISYDYTVGVGSVQSTAGPSFTLVGLTGGVVPIRVRTVVPGGYTSVWATATVNDVVIVPGKPNVELPANVGEPGVTASWPPASGAVGYEYQVDGGPSITTTGLSVALPRLSPGTTTLRVRSRNNLTSSDWSIATVTYSVPVPSVQRPSAPSIVKRRRKFTVSTVVVAPEANPASTVTFRFYRYQKVGRRYRWVLKQSVSARGSGTSGTMTYRARLALSKTGNWCVTAAYSGAGTYADVRTAPRALRVR